MIRSKYNRKPYRPSVSPFSGPVGSPPGYFSKRAKEDLGAAPENKRKLIWGSISEPATNIAAEMIREFSQDIYGRDRKRLAVLNGKEDKHSKSRDFLVDNPLVRCLRTLLRKF